jgi:hypothetical protein
MAEKQEQAKEPAFSVQTLIENAKGLSGEFGAKPELIVAVLSSCTGEITKAEAKKRIETFLKCEVK